MATAPAVGANLKRQLEQIGEEIADLQTSAANHAKELESIEGKRLTCPPAEIEKLMNRKDVVKTLQDRLTLTLAERQTAYDAVVREIRAEEKAWRDGEPFRKIAALSQEMEADLAPLRAALDPRAWQRVQKNLFELRSMSVLNIQTTPRVSTMSGPVGERAMQSSHAPLAREEASKVVGQLAPLYTVLAGILGR